MFKELLRGVRSYINFAFLRLIAGVLICPFLFFIKGAQAQAPQLKFKHINNLQGLSNSTIEAIYQDSRGFIWFGTRDGLNRYDGYQIIVYKNIANAPGSLSDNYIRCISEDATHNLWVGTINGLNKFDPDKNQFTRYKHDPKKSGSLSGNNINCIYNDKAGVLWIGTTDGSLNRYSTLQNNFVSYKDAALPNAINAIYEDEANRFWIGTANGLKLFNRQSSRYQQVVNDFNNSPIKLNYPVNSIQQDKLGKLWLGIDNSGILVVDLQNNNLQWLKHQRQNAGSLSNDQVKCLLKDSKNQIWAGSINGGLDLYIPSQNQFKHYQNESDNSSSLSQRTVSALFEDKQNNLWAGTHRGGVNLYTPQANKFKLLHNIAGENSLSYNDVRAFYEDENANIWIGTDGGGLNVYNPLQNTFKTYRYNPLNANSLASDAVLDIMQDAGQDMWVSTWGGGLNHLNRATSQFTHYTNTPGNAQTISSNYVQKSLIDSKGNFWVATYYGGLNLFDKATGKFKRITASADGRSRLTGNNIVSIKEDRQQNLWIGTDDGGLNCYNLNTRQFKHYFNNQDKYPDLRIIFIDHKGQLWIGQNGLYLFDKQTQKFKLFTTKGGLGTEFIKGIEEDVAHHLWISTSNGLTKLDPQKLSTKKYNTADGLQGQEFEANASLKAKNGLLYFGGVNGFNQFNPQSINANPFIPPVYITSLQVFNKLILPDSADSPLRNDISSTKEIKLSYKQSTIAFTFSALNYTATENNQYAYKLEGLDNNWYYTGNERKVSFTNLGPGQYTLYIKASNNDGIWNQQGASLHITITPPFWATWWFRLGVTVVIGYIAYLILKFKKNLDLQKIEEQKREEIHQHKLQFFTNISHEFRTPLSLIMGPLENLLKDDKQLGNTHQYQMMYRNANRLMLLINELMDFRKVESGALQLKVMPGNINMFVKELAEEFTGAAIQKDIQIDIKLQANLTQAWFDRQLLEKIVLNLINNSLKYTPTGGKIVVEVLSSLNDFKPSFENSLVVKNSFRAKQYCYVRIADDGIGISKESINHLFERYYRITEAHLGSGIGLAFVKSLTVMHKGDIYVHSQRHEGTEIIIALPCTEIDYSTNEKWQPTTIEGGIRLESVTMPLAANNAEPILQQQPHAKPQSDYRVLIVDDNPEIRTFLRNCLQEEYDIVEAPDGALGMEVAREDLPDLIVSDVMMPGVNGLDFCKSIKENVETSHIPFLMLTAKTNLQSEIEGFESGADLYLFKPVSPNLLKLSIRNIFEQRQKLKERYSKNYNTEIRELIHTAKDQEFMDRVLQTIEAEMSNPELDIDMLCKSVGMSRTKLYHKIKQISGQSTNEFIRSIRLKKAVEIMTHEDVLLTEVMYRVGIQTQSYFTKAFKKEFGKTPSQFINDLQGVSTH